MIIFVDALNKNATACSLQLFVMPMTLPVAAQLQGQLPQMHWRWSDHLSAR